MNNSEQLRELTSASHRKIESTSPFSQLLIKEEGQSALEKMVHIFYEFYYPHIIHHHKILFFENVLHLFDQYFGPNNDQKNTTIKNPVFDLAVRYTFLGSRFGNQYMMKKNPNLLHSSYYGYLTIPLDHKLWIDTVQEVNQLSPEDFKKLVNDVNQIYNRLIQISNQFSPT